MATGQLRHLVTFQRQGDAELDEFGQLPRGGAAYEDAASVYARVRPAGSRERLASAQMQSELTHVVTVRYRPDLACAAGSWRVVWGDRRFGVVGLPRNREERDRWLDFDCVERVNA